MPATTGTYTRTTGILLAGLLLIAPFVFLQNLLTELVKTDEAHLEILAREKLVNEMESFQDSLKPDKYIQNALSMMNRQFNLLSSADRQRQLTHSREENPNLIDSTFIDKARNYLEQNYHIKPFLMLSADCDLQNHWIWTSLKLFPDEKACNSFAETALLGMAFVEGDPRNFLKSTASLSLRKAAFVVKNMAIHTDPHQVFANLFHDFISVFSNPPLYADRVLVFFSNRFGNQRSYQYFHLVNTGFPPNEYLLGFYYSLFNNCDIPPAAMLRNSLKSHGHGTRRYIAPRVVRQPFFHEESGKLLYFSGFPTAFHTAAEDYGIKNPETRRQLLAFLKQHCLVTSVDAAITRSAYRRAIKLVGGALKLLLLLLLAFAVRMLPGAAILNIRLSGKLRLAVAISVMLPVAGVLVVNLLIRDSSERLKIHNCQAQIKQRLQLFEKILEENDPRLVMITQEFKKYFADCYAATPAGGQLKAGATDPYLLLKFASHSLFFAHDAYSLKFSNQFYQKIQTQEMIGLYRILAELNAVSTQNKVIQDLNRKQLFLNTMMDSFWSVFAAGPILARESLPVKNFLSFSALKRAIYHLIARPETPHKPEGILFHEIGDNNINRLLLKQLWHKAPTILSHYSEDQQIDFGLHLRGPTELRELHVPRSGPAVASLRAIAAKALERRTSGSSVSNEGDKIVINSWLYYDDIPVIITARAMIPAVPLHTPVYFLIPLALLAYAILAMGLLSETLADALLVPVQTLLAFVRSIQNNQLNVRVEIKSGDEFAELADSFNRMSVGLCQREKMRRFVSDRLYQSLENTRQDKSIGQTLVTIISSDIRNFTAISEKFPPEEIVSLLNDYFSAMETAITANGGSIEKIVGDAIIAAFYSDSGSGSHSVRACEAALEMRRQLA
ncbi:MAG: adenylate/guanylate cyclase domain-containing protein, partial [Candidatus Riflebacteria bacterium]|nr:adenylate/guanylate cyclase domain-containing protein [Candidatus Riflebacteria bacterium]